MLLKILDYVCSRIANALIGLVSVLPRPNRFHGDGKKHILIVANDRLGDTMIRLPFYANVRKCFPREDWHITIVLTSENARAFAALPYFDEIVQSPHLNDNHALFWFFAHGKILAPILRWSFVHRVEVLVIPLRERSLGHDYVFKLTCPKFSIAYTSDRRKNLFPMSAAYQMRTYDKKYSRLMELIIGRHQFDDLAQIFDCMISSAVIQTMGTVVKRKMGQIPLTEMAPMLDYSFARDLGLRQYVVLIPGAKDILRQWPPKRFALLADRIGGDIVVLGSSGEFHLGELVADGVKHAKIINLCGKTTIAQLGGVLAGSSFVASNETGTASYAAVLGVPTVCILGGGDFGAFFPNPHCTNTTSVYHEMGCFFCQWCCSDSSHEEGCVAPCISNITVEEVYEATQVAIKFGRGVPFK